MNGGREGNATPMWKYQRSGEIKTGGGLEGTSTGEINGWNGVARMGRKGEDGKLKGWGQGRGRNDGSTHSGKTEGLTWRLKDSGPFEKERLKVHVPTKCL